MLSADGLADTQTEIDGMWVCSRPLTAPFWRRLRDALAVLFGRADAVRFHKQ